MASYMVKMNDSTNVTVLDDTIIIHGPALNISLVFQGKENAVLYGLSDDEPFHLVIGYDTDSRMKMNDHRPNQGEVMEDVIDLNTIGNPLRDRAIDWIGRINDFAIRQDKQIIITTRYDTDNPRKPIRELHRQRLTAVLAAIPELGALPVRTATTTLLEALIDYLEKLPPRRPDWSALKDV